MALRLPAGWRSGPVRRSALPRRPPLRPELGRRMPQLQCRCEVRRPGHLAAAVQCCKPRRPQAWDAHAFMASQDSALRGEAPPSSAPAGGGGGTGTGRGPRRSRGTAGICTRPPILHLGRSRSANPAVIAVAGSGPYRSSCGLTPSRKRHQPREEPHSPL